MELRQQWTVPAAGCVSTSPFTFHPLEVLDDGEDHLMCPLQGRWSSTGPTGAGGGARQPSGLRTDLDDVDAVQRVD